MLKLIPSEITADNRPPGRGRKNKFMKRSSAPNPKRQKQYFAEIRDQNGKLKKICVRMVKFVKGGNHSTQEISEMIHGLQESVVCLEKQRQKMMWGQKRKPSKE